MIRSTKTTLIRLGEAIAAVAAVLLFFLIFMVIIGLIFPEGTNLGALVRSQGHEFSETVASQIDLETTGAESFIAVLSETHRSVKNKPVNAIAWFDSRTGMPLGERHSVQTLERSGAVITFGGEDRLALQENSLVVIRSMTRHARERRRQTSVVALEGRLRGRVASGTPEKEEMEIEVVTPNGTARIRPLENEDADYDVSVNPDDTSTFSIRSGYAEVSNAGETVSLKSDQTVTVARSEPPGQPVPLPAAPALGSPRDGMALVFRSIAPRVRFEWSGETDEYRLEIGRDAEFQQMVYAERIRGTEFEHGNLPAGRLYWRVTALDGWAEAPLGRSRRLDLIQDTEAPGLEVSFPEGSVPVSGALLHGVAEPGTRVFVSDHDVPLEASGSFAHALSLDPGLNLVIVEAIDAAGNVTYRSKLIKAEHARSSQ